MCSEIFYLPSDQELTLFSNMGDESVTNIWSSAGAPAYDVQKDESLRSFDDSINAVSFGFVATAVLISMFLVMAIFERLVRPTSPGLSPSGGRNLGDVEEAQMRFCSKLGYPSPKVNADAKEISILMPGENLPTFIAHPAPVPCPPERMQWPPHQQ